MLGRAYEDMGEAIAMLSEDRARSIDVFEALRFWYGDVSFDSPHDEHLRTQTYNSAANRIESVTYQCLASFDAFWRNGTYEKLANNPRGIELNSAAAWIWNVNKHGQASRKRSATDLGRR